MPLCDDPPYDCLISITLTEAEIIFISLRIAFYCRTFVQLSRPVVVLPDRSRPPRHQLRPRRGYRRQLGHQHAGHGSARHARTGLPDSSGSSRNGLFLRRSHRRRLLRRCRVPVPALPHLRQRRQLLGKVLLPLSQRNTVQPGLKGDRHVDGQMSKWRNSVRIVKL